MRGVTSYILGLSSVAAVLHYLSLEKLLVFSVTLALIVVLTVLLKKD